MKKLKKQHTKIKRKINLMWYIYFVFVLNTMCRLWFLLYQGRSQDQQNEEASLLSLLFLSLTFFFPPFLFP